MRIGEVARRSGVSVRALRYYEEQGLLTPTRSPGGQRQYADDTVDRVRFFQQLYAAGLPSRRIAELLPCVDTGTTTGEQRAMLDAERARIRQQIDEYTAALARLDEIVAAAAERRG
ncbi:MerR family transcriptional regulator [Streptomyces sp. NBC_01808]|uniref:MerR family transcriptional regulator n=1 Tax=Streptomyces sp. NBC_01808 TaxID=2975947 RepID=UPI002DDB2824|nr:MerR family transcriptional regulator [Streptomyces sp. NBC_01808]WSA38699.1 MerR family transcriptional regulator [Streptomyces sp. NBC_01808]